MRQSSTAIYAGMLAIGIGLAVRSPVTSVAALLGPIEHAYGFGPTGLAVLSALPVLMFGLAAPLGPLLVRRLGLERATAALLGVLALAVLLRPVAASVLLAGTVIVGAAISALGIVTPQIVRTHLAGRAGLWSGAYTSAFGVSAAAGAAAAVPVLGLVAGHVPAALSAWGAPIAVTALLALVGTGMRGRLLRPSAPPAAAPARILGAPRLWSVTILFGSQALVYFTLTAWIPTIATDRGMSPSDAGMLLAWMSVAGIPSALAAPAVAARLRSQSGVAAVITAISMIGITGFALAPTALTALFVGLTGLSQSAAFGFSVGLIVARSPTPEQTTAFSAFAQGIGYALAATGPLLFGLLAHGGVPRRTMILGLLGVLLIQLASGIRAGRPPIAPARPPAPKELSRDHGL